MNKLFLLVAIFFTACTDGSIRKNFDSHDLSRVMAYGSVKELNAINPEIEKDLLIRLYQSPIFGESCFIETHAVCRYNYYLSVSTFDEFPQSNVFKLKMVGKVTDIHWLKETKYDYVEIEFTINQYTKEALVNNPALVNTSTSVLIKVDPNRLIESIR